MWVSTHMLATLLHFSVIPCLLYDFYLCWKSFFLMNQHSAHVFSSCALSGHTFETYLCQDPDESLRLFHVFSAPTELDIHLEAGAPYIVLLCL